MTKAQFSVLASLVAANLVATALPLVLPASATPSYRYPSYEYKVVAPDDEKLMDELATAGDLGWDIVTARRAVGEGKGAAYEMILRRPR